MAGQGWRMLRKCLSVGRGITLAVQLHWRVKSVALATGAYAHIRRQFKISIGKMEGIEEMLARIAGNAYVMDAAIVNHLRHYAGRKPAVLSAIVKYHCTRTAPQQSIIDAMDITGGKGIMLARAPGARAYRGAPIAITVKARISLIRSMMILVRLPAAILMY